MIISKAEIAEVEYPVLHDCLYNINRIHSNFKYCYMDSKGELALMFDGMLSDDDVKGILFELSAVEDTPYSPAKDGPSAMELQYGRTHRIDDVRNCTEVYSKDGWDYRKQYLV